MSKLICDSNSEVWFSKLKEFGVDFISMPYLVEDKEFYYDLGEKTDFPYFYDAVRGGAIPKTMALNPEDYKEILTPYFEKGEDVLYVSFSHAMSGTFNQLNSALKELKELYPERECKVFDTKAISVGAGLQVEAAARMKKEGKSDEEILAFLRSFRDRVALYFVVDDLMHLKRGGRLTATAAFAGTILGIKPVLTLDSKGGLNVAEKVVGKKKAIRVLADKVCKELTGTEYTVYVLHADCEDDADVIERMIKEKRPEAKIEKQIIGPVIGSHCGAGTLGVVFVADKRPIPLEDCE